MLGAGKERWPGAKGSVRSKQQAQSPPGDRVKEFPATEKPGGSRLKRGAGNGVLQCELRRYKWGNIWESERAELGSELKTGDR